MATRLPFLAVPLAPGLLEVFEAACFVLEFLVGRFEEAALVGVFLFPAFEVAFREVVGFLDAAFLAEVFLLAGVLEEGFFAPDFAALVFLEVVGFFVPVDLEVFLLGLAVLKVGFFDWTLLELGFLALDFPLNDLDAALGAFFEEPEGLLDERLFDEGRLLVDVRDGAFFALDFEVVGRLEVGLEARRVDFEGFEFFADGFGDVLVFEESLEFDFGFGRLEAAVFPLRELVGDDFDGGLVLLEALFDEGCLANGDRVVDFEDGVVLLFFDESAEAAFWPAATFVAAFFNEFFDVGVLDVEDFDLAVMSLATAGAFFGRFLGRASIEQDP